MMINESKKGYIFDLDGTLADSVKIWFDVDTKFLNFHGVTPTNAYHKQIENLNFELAVKFLIEHFKIDKTYEEASAQILEMIHHEYSHNILLKKGAKEYLYRAKAEGKKIALATSSIRHCCLALLEREGIAHLFDVMLFSGELQTTKKEPYIYLESAKALNLAPKDCAVFEDMTTGLIVARGTGMYAVAIADGLSPSDLQIMQNNADEVHFDWTNICAL